MTDKSDRIQSLLKKYITNNITEDEYREFWDLLDDGLEENTLPAELKILWQNSAREQISLPTEEWDSKMQHLMKYFGKINIEAAPLKQKTFWLSEIRWRAAAVLILLLGGAIYWSIIHSARSDAIKPGPIAITEKSDIDPGRNSAVLTLVDGTMIKLDSAANGILAKQGNAKVIKLANGQISYDASNAKAEEIGYNTLRTPRGGQYQVILPDGSKVWLNANSSLKYPTVFAHNERKVEVTGEAYFEVTKNASKPFKVNLSRMEIEVLGTHFNVNAYDDEPIIQTTLLEGSIRLNRNNGTSLLKPGQQAQLDKIGKIKLENDVDLEEAVAWKDGKFQFEDATIEEVMRQLARWYNVEVEYKEKVLKHFEGTISRSANLSQVLLMLETTGGVKFKVEGQKIIITS